MLSTISLVILFAQYACCVTILNPLYCSVLFFFPSVVILLSALLSINLPTSWKQTLGVPAKRIFLLMQVSTMETWKKSQLNEE